MIASSNKNPLYHFSVSSYRWPAVWQVINQGSTQTGSFRVAKACTRTGSHLLWPEQVQHQSLCHKLIQGEAFPTWTRQEALLNSSLTDKEVIFGLSSRGRYGLCGHKRSPILSLFMKMFSEFLERLSCSVCQVWLNETHLDFCNVRETAAIYASTQRSV